MSPTALTLRNIELCIFKPIPVCGSFRPFQSSNPIISCSCICSSPYGHWILPVPFMLLISCPEFTFTKSPEGGTHTKCLLHFESGAQSKDALLTISWGNHLKWMKPMEIISTKPPWLWVPCWFSWNVCQTLLHLMFLDVIFGPLELGLTKSLYSPHLPKKKKLPCTCGYGSARASLQHDTSKRTSESDLNAMLAQMWYTNVILHAFKKTVHKKKLYPCPFKLCVGTKIDQHQKCHLEICHVFVCKSSPVRGMVDPWLEGLHLGA